MRILDLQRRLHETGRIRIGEQVEATTKEGKKVNRPKRLETFRFTSRSVPALEAIAARYGGDTVPWPEAPTSGQWELVTKSSEIKVLVPPEQMSLSQAYELWSGGGCQRRCDGRNQVPGGEPCVCDPEYRECKIHTRLSVILEGIQGTGLWRLDTQGYYAATELGGAQDLGALISQATGRSILPATLRLDQREVKRPGQPTRQFAVPVLDFDVDVSALAGPAHAAIEMGGGLMPVPAAVAGSDLASELRDIDEGPGNVTRRANAAEPVRPTGVAPRPVTVRDGEDMTEPVTDRPELASVESRVKLGDFLSLLEGNEAERVATAWKHHVPPLPPSSKIEYQWQVDAAMKLVLAVTNEFSTDDDPPAPADVPGLIDANSIETPMATPYLVRRVNIALSDWNITERQDRLERIGQIVGHPVASSKNLTKAEAQKVIDQLNEGDFPLPRGEHLM